VTGTVRSGSVQESRDQSKLISLNY
jgi:hypothetical protein